MEPAEINLEADAFIEVLDDADDQEVVQVMLARCKTGGPTRARLLTDQDAARPQILSVDEVGQA